MKIEKLIQLTRSKELVMLKQIIDLGKPITYSELVRINQRNPQVIKKSLNRFYHAGFLIKEKKPMKIGRNKAVINYDHYRINNENEVIKFLLK